MRGRRRDRPTSALGAERLLASGELVQILPEWGEERFPLYAHYPSRHLPPAKVRALLDFVTDRAVQPTRLITHDGGTACPDGQDG